MLRVTVRKKAGNAERGFEVESRRWGKSTTAQLIFGPAEVML
jgi:hypothetical protein